MTDSVQLTADTKVGDEGVRGEGVTHHWVLAHTYTGVVVVSTEVVVLNHPTFPPSPILYTV